MALISCPDCSGRISDTAVSCPHCGRPMRLSRESILIEMQIAEGEDNRLRDVIDDVMKMNVENYDPVNQETIRGAWAKIEELRQRIGELRAMLT